MLFKQDALALGEFSNKTKVDPLEIERLSKSEGWSNIIHLEQSLFGVEKIVEGKQFYLSAPEYFSPESELLQSIKRIKEESFSTQLQAKSFQCQFPSRSRWLYENLAITAVRKDCINFQYWLEAYSVSEISLIYILPDTGSMETLFGELYLKLHSGNKEVEDQLVSFKSLNINPNFPFKSYWDALWKGAEGQITIAPFSKVKASIPYLGRRDVWEYHLNLSEKEKFRILAGLWELYQQGELNFKFNRGTGPYYIGRIIQLARPSVAFAAHLSSIATPAEVLKYLSKKSQKAKDWISKISFHPSAFRKAFFRDQSLVFKDELLLEELISGEIGAMSEDRRIPLEKGLARMIWTQWKKALPPDSQQQQVYDDLKERLNDLGEETQKTDLDLSQVKKPWSPHKMHGKSAVGLGQGIAKGGESIREFSFRFGLHDFLNNDVGFPKFTQLEVLKFRYRQFDDQVTNRESGVEEATLVELVSLLPSNREVLPSWALKLSYQRPLGMLDQEIKVVHSRFGPGMAFESILGKYKFYGIAQVLFEYSSNFPEGNFRFGSILRGGVLAQPLNYYKLNLEIFNLFDLQTQMGYKLQNNVQLTHSLLMGRRMDLRLASRYVFPLEEGWNKYHEHLLSAILYF